MSVFTVALAGLEEFPNGDVVLFPFVAVVRGDLGPEGAIQMAKERYEAERLEYDGVRTEVVDLVVTMVLAGEHEDLAAPEAAGEAELLPGERDCFLA